MFGASNTGFGGFGQQNQQNQTQQQQTPATGGLFGNTSGGFGSCEQSSLALSTRSELIWSRSSPHSFLAFGASTTPAFGAPAQQPAQNTGFGELSALRMGREKR